MPGRGWASIGVLVTSALVAGACNDEEPEPDDPLARGASLFEIAYVRELQREAGLID